MLKALLPYKSDKINQPSTMKKWILIISVICFGNVQAQDIEQIIKSKPFEFKGRLSAGATYNYTSSSTQNLSPFSYRLSLNSTVTVYSFDFPFNLTLIDSRFSHTEPTFRLKLNPKYKWVQLYFGDNAYNFSEFTVSGQNINGVGLALTPGNFEFTAFYGTIDNFILQQFVTENEYEIDLLPTYKRNAIGAKIGYGINSFKAEISGASVKDKYDIKSADFSTLSVESRPKENTVVGIKLSSNITRYFEWGIDVGASVITEDATSREVENLDEQVQKWADILPSKVNESTRIGIAGNAFAKVKVAQQTFGVTYKRVQPEYKSLGLFYINDDFQNIAFNTTLNLLKGKVRFAGSYGTQTNNLNGWKTATSKRRISSVNLTVRLVQSLSIMANYANHSQNQEAGFVETSSSALPELGQVTQNFTISPIYTIMNKKSTQSYSLNYSNFNFSRYEDDNLQDGGASTNQNVTASYSYSHKKGQWGMRFGANYFTSDVNNVSSNRYGISAGANKAFFKKLRASVNTTFNISNSENNTENTVINNNSATVNYRISKKQSLNFSLYQTNGTIISNEKASTLRINFAYSLNF